MDGINLDFITTASGDDNKYTISGIPDKLWEIFKETAEKSMPEHGKTAWASVLTEIIQKNVRSSVYTYIMTDIPQAAKDAFEQTANQAELSTDHVIGIMFRQAMEGKLHILNMITEEGSKEGYRVLVIAGLSDPAWKKWAEVANGVELAPEELLGLMFQASVEGNLTLEPAPQDPHNVDFEGRENGI